MRERQHLDDAINAYAELERSLSDNIELIELGEEEGDTEIVAEAEKALTGLLKIAQKREVEALLSGEADGNDAYLEVHAGAGGTESQDWAQMLLRMYMRWAEEKRFKTELMETSAGEEAGLKSATLLVKGTNAYGWLKTESGVHRLVRISPFDSNARRHTSFASVWVYPAVDDTINIEINESDCRIDTYRSSRGRRPARQHHRFRGAHHPSADRHRRAVPERALTAQEPCHRLGDAQGASL